MIVSDTFGPYLIPAISLLMPYSFVIPITLFRLFIPRLSASLYYRYAFCLVIVRSGIVDVLHV